MRACRSAHSRVRLRCSTRRCSGRCSTSGSRRVDGGRAPRNSRAAASAHRPTIREPPTCRLHVTVPSSPRSTAASCAAACRMPRVFARVPAIAHTTISRNMLHMRLAHRA
eukprot:scaffold3558_cov127-Isochrysis_galbana.AAC.5